MSLEISNYLCKRVQNIITNHFTSIVRKIEHLWKKKKSLICNCSLL